MGVVHEADRERLLIAAPRSRLLFRDASLDARPTTAAPVALFGLPFCDTTVAAASLTIVDAALARRRTRVVFANAHVINEIAIRPGYADVVRSADRVYADGSGLAIAASLAGRPLRDNVNGTDLFPRLAADAAAAGVRIFLLGGRPGIADAARRTMSGFGLADSLVGTHHGYFAGNDGAEDAAIAAANASGADIVLVGMGVPLQDEWIERNAHRLHAPVLIGVGGLFDYFAGAVSRAPHALRVAGCEWVWRLALEPRRMARRYLIGNAVFMARAVAHAVHVQCRDGVSRMPGVRRVTLQASSGTDR